MERYTLRQARMYRGRTLQEVAEELKVHRVTVANYETGKTVIPADKFLQLCDYLNLEPSKFNLEQ